MEMSNLWRKDDAIKRGKRTDLLSGKLSISLDNAVLNEPVVDLRVGPGRPN